MNGIPWHTDPWSDLTALLSMGGHIHRGPDGTISYAVVDRQFDIVLSLYQRYGHGPATGVPRRYLDIPDGNLTPAHLDGVRDLAELGAARIHAGSRVLARCQAGYNRSGLLAAFILLRLGYTAIEAIGLIRTRRGPYALCNEHFVDLIHAEYATLHGEDWREHASWILDERGPIISQAGDR